MDMLRRDEMEGDDLKIAVKKLKQTDPFDDEGAGERKNEIRDIFRKMFPRKTKKETAKRIYLRCKESGMKRDDIASVMKQCAKVDEEEAVHWTNEALRLYSVIGCRINISAFFIAFMEYVSRGLTSSERHFIPKNEKIAMIFPDPTFLSRLGVPCRLITKATKLIKETNETYKVEDYIMELPLVSKKIP